MKKRQGRDGLPSVCSLHMWTVNVWLSSSVQNESCLSSWWGRLIYALSGSELQQPSHAHAHFIFINSLVLRVNMISYVWRYKLTKTP